LFLFFIITFAFSTFAFSTFARLRDCLCKKKTKFFPFAASALPPSLALQIFP